jgi:hypothetical protein
MTTGVCLGTASSHQAAKRSVPPLIETTISPGLPTGIGTVTRPTRPRNELSQSSSFTRADSRPWARRARVWTYSTVATGHDYAGQGVPWYGDTNWRADWWIAAVAFVYSDLPDDGGAFITKLMETGRDEGYVMSLMGGVVGMAMPVRAVSAASAITAAEAWMLNEVSVSTATWKVGFGTAYRMGGQPDPCGLMKDPVIQQMFGEWAREVED